MAPSLIKLQDKTREGGTGSLRFLLVELKCSCSGRAAGLTFDCAHFPTDLFIALFLHLKKQTLAIFQLVKKKIKACF